MLYIIRFWLFVIVMTMITFLVLKLFGRERALLKIFLFWIAATLLSVALLYGVSLLVSERGVE
ncbi:hypothetical protein SAMN05443662_1215 [Sulfurivirga caldicuralii]|uniref:Uncharacterized protein n=1 Tax=Sulfurivirga caldicuralii TaxID=364032 RepID=A0A1N6G6R1_9GAMM|nr:hypothetical protein [Sulfurivirga caldicuralii]SIO03187.1 hypothetical protein SAMN05443662_1215 [Sulfurivirga caldicuralii]